MYVVSLLVLVAVGAPGLAAHLHHAVETEMFAIPISPNLFNWTYQGKRTYYVHVFFTTTSMAYFVQLFRVYLYMISVMISDT